jgi:uncharacterized membrane protein
LEILPLLAAHSPGQQSALVQEPMAVLAVLLAVLASLFAANQHPRFSKIFRIIPLLVFAYFLPTALSNLGVIPLKSPLYAFTRNWLLPASLVLLVLSVDIPAILRLGKPALILFLTATASIVIGGPISYALFAGWIPPDMRDQAWRGLAAVAGSWIGGGANFIAIGKSVGVDESMLNMMVVVDVAVANVWMAVLLFFAGREKTMDKKLGADRKALDDVRNRVEAYQAEVLRPSTLADLMLIVAIAFAVTAVAKGLAPQLPSLGDIIGTFTWVILLVTTTALVFSFTPLRRLEGAGASKIGSVFLYLLVATIGAKAEFAKVLDAPIMVVIGAFWMMIHATLLMTVQRWLKIPIFFAAVGSQANVGGAASAPIVAAAFHPALAPVGILLAVAGYVLGIYAGLICAFLLEFANGFVF